MLGKMTWKMDFVSFTHVCYEILIQIIFCLLQHFVSDRKVDEDLGRTTRFLYDDDHLKDVSICIGFIKLFVNWR